jgi:chromosome partitioning protein
VSAGLALLQQQRVLLVDCDPRGHASLALGVDMQHVRYSVTDLLTGAMPEVQALGWDTGDNLKLLPANATLHDVEPELWQSGEGRWRTARCPSDLDIRIPWAPPGMARE